MGNLVLAPFQPTEEQWGGLARDIVWWMRSYPSNKHTPATLVEHLGNLGREIPAWMGSEAELRAQDHVISKGTIAVLIYKAMLAAAPQQGGELIDELSMMAQMLGERDPADELSLLLFRAVGALRMADDRDQQYAMKVKAREQRDTMAAEVQRLREALEGMLEYFPVGHSDGECFSIDAARAALSAEQGEGERA